MGKIQCKQDQNFLSPMNNINIIIIIIKNTFSNFSTPYSLWIPSCNPYNANIGGRNINVAQS